jgi:hypothetical protein
MKNSRQVSLMQKSNKLFVIFVSLSLSLSLFLITFIPGHSQIVCGTVAEVVETCYDGYFDNMDEFVPGTYHRVPVDVFILRNSNGSGGPTKSEVVSVLKQAFSYFRPHDIHFHLACISEIHADSFYENPRLLMFPTQLDSNPDNRIIVYVASENSPVEFGLSPVASGRSWANIENFNNFLTSARLFAHEIGHSIGLVHTFERTDSICISPDIFCPEYSGANSEDCELRGDFVCDTPGDPGSGRYNWSTFDECLIDGASTCFDLNNVQYEDILVNNIMNYSWGHCDESMEFTNGQGDRMRWCLQAYFSPSLEINNNVIVDDITINDHQEWDEETYSYGNIRIVGGGSLLLSDMTLFMDGGKKIRVDPGGILHLTNTKITASAAIGQCIIGLEEILWQGIEVYGNPAFTQFGSPLNQGKLILESGSIIEQARIGIFAGFFTSQGGGIVYASNSEISNCRIGILMGPYSNKAGSLIFPNQSYFNNMSFTMNDDYLGSSFQAHMWLRGISGIPITSSTFDFEHSTIPPGVGIVASNSLMYVQGTPSSQFRNLDFGINASSNIPSAGIRISNAKFKDNHIGFYGHGVLSHMHDCSIEVGGYEGYIMDDIHEGVVLDATSKFLAYKNKFKHSGTAFNTIGLRVNNSGEVTNSIEANSFEDLDIGNQTQGVNFNLLDDQIGLLYKCNTNTENTLHDFNTLEQGVARIQGASDEPAGNTFSHTLLNPLFGSDWNNEGGEITYFFKEGSTYEEPLYYTNLEKINIITYVSSCPTITEPGPSEPHDHAGNRDALDNLKDEYDGLIDGGQTATLITNIQNATNPTKVSVFTQLDTLAPWLSLDVAMEFVDRTDLYSDSIMTLILRDNPDILHNGFLEVYLEEKTVPMASRWIDTVLQVVGTVTPRTDMMAEIGQLAAILQQGVVRDLIRVQLDTNGMTMDSIRNILQYADGFQAQLDIVSSYLAEGDTTSAISAYTSLSSTASSSAFSSDAYDDFGEFMALSISLIRTSRDWSELDSLELVTLTELAEEGAPSIAAAAGGLLNAYYEGNWFTPAIWNEAELDEDRNNEGTPVISRDKLISFAYVFPNPSDGLIRFTIQDQNRLDGSYDLMIIDNTGTVIYRNVFGSSVEWLCNTCPGGLYHYRIVDQSNGKTQTGHIVLK